MGIEAHCADGGRDAWHTARDRGDDMSRRKKNKGRSGGGGGGQRSSGGGVMRSIVRGFRTVAHGGSGSGSNKATAVKKRTTWDVVTWVLLAGAVGFLIYKALG